MKDDDGEERLLHREQVEQQVRTERTGTKLLQHTDITQQEVYAYWTIGAKSFVRIFHCIFAHTEKNVTQ